MGRKDSSEGTEWEGWDQVEWGQDYQRLGRKIHFSGEGARARAVDSEQS